ncbi:MAG: hypothetical protein ACLVL7_04350 [Anaerotruncus massiliensis (ex Togo et al. 2019)]
MKRLIAMLLCACLLLAGCGIPDPPRPAPSRPDAPAAVSVPEQTASSHPEAPSAPAEQPGIEAEPPPEESLSPARTAELLAAALREGDVPALEALANPAFGVEGKLDYWKTVSIDSVSHGEPEQDGEDWLCRFTLEVSDPGETPLKTGENACVARIGCAPYGMWDRYSVLSFAPAGKEIPGTELSRSAAARQVRWMRDFAFFETFDDPAEIDRGALLDFLLGTAARDYPEQEATPIGIGSGLGYTQAQLDAVAGKYFGLDGFAMTDCPSTTRERLLWAQRARRRLPQRADCADRRGRGPVRRLDRTVRRAVPAPAERRPPVYPRAQRRRQLPVPLGEGVPGCAGIIAERGDHGQSGPFT